MKEGNGSRSGAGASPSASVASTPGAALATPSATPSAPGAAPSAVNAAPSLAAATPSSAGATPSPSSAEPRRSLTADIVSVARGIGVSHTLRDPLAIHFASRDVKPLLEAFEAHARLGRVLRGALRRLSLGLVDHNTLRMWIIDDLLRAWLAAGRRQVVILGAGMDSRGWRLPELAEATLFELDRAPTQRLKQARSAGLRARCGDVRFVSADLERDPLAAALLGAGFQPQEPAAWLCEGVTPYLGVPSIAGLLGQVAELSAPGSRLAMSYVAPKGGGRRGIAQRLAARLGEPPRGVVAATELHRHAAAAGLACVADLDWKEWVARVAGYRPVRNVFEERLLVAERPHPSAAPEPPRPAASTAPRTPPTSTPPRSTPPTSA